MEGISSFHAERLVVIVNGLRDFFRFALCASVEAADDALQIGEFFDHVGGEIALAQQGGALRLVAAELASPMRLLAGSSRNTNQLGLERNVLQIFERGLRAFSFDPDPRKTGRR